MGSIISKYYDDVEEYEYLCKKYGEKVRKVYSKHHRLLQEKNNGSELSFDKYLKREKIEQLKFEIKNKLSKLSQLKQGGDIEQVTEAALVEDKVEETVIKTPSKRGRK